jgi:DNA polymerase III subunit delta
MTESDLRKQLAKRNLLPVYLLHGEEDFLIERAAKAIADAALLDGDRSFNFHTFRGSEHKAEDVISSANSFPFMADKRVVLVKECEKFFTAPSLQHYLRNPNPDAVLILCAEALSGSGRKKAGSSAKKSMDVLSFLTQTEREKGPAGVLEFKALKDAAAQEWIVAEFAAAGKRITPEACTVFNTLKGNNARVLSSEIDKIITAEPDAEKIGADEVYAHLGASREFNVFELSNAVSARNAALAHSILIRVLVTEEPVMILNTLLRQMLLLWKIRSYSFAGRATDEDARSLGAVFGWQIENTRQYLTNFRDSEYFERCFEYFLEADLAIKTLPVSAEIAITKLVTQLTQR